MLPVLLAAAAVLMPARPVLRPAPSQRVPQPVCGPLGSEAEMTLGWATDHDIERRFGPGKVRRKHDAETAASMTLGWATEHDIDRRYWPRQQSVAPPMRQPQPPRGSGAPTMQPPPGSGTPPRGSGAPTAPAAEMSLGWATEHDIERRFGARNPQPPRTTRMKQQPQAAPVGGPPVPSAPPAEMTLGWATEHDLGRRFAPRRYVGETLR